MKKGIVIFQPDGKRTEVEVGKSLLDVAKAAGIKLESICGGKTTCGKCKIIVNRGAENLNEVTEAEMRLVKTGKLSQELLNKGYRIACATKIKSLEKSFRMPPISANVIVTVPLETRLGAQKILVEGTETKVLPNSLVNKYYVELPKPTLDDPTSDFERLVKTLSKKHSLKEVKVSHLLLEKLPASLRSGDWKTTVAVWDDNEIISVEPGNTVERKFGLAVDIGTTTVVGYLTDLNNGKLVGHGSLLNPQIPYGEDVMTRITHSIENSDGLHNLNRVITEGLNDIINEACSGVKVKPEEIYEITIVGNTAMHHLFLKLNPKFLALSPFAPVVKRSVDIKASELGLKVNPCANVHVLPVIAGFVGADTVGVILSTNFYKEPQMKLATDIGTNGEMMFGNEDGIEVCSTAAGPAFEGAHLKYGMRGEPGAIESVSIDPNTLDVEYGTIDDAPARGVCGSGIVDAVAQMFMAGIMLKTGNLNNRIKNSRLRESDTKQEFVLAWADETEEGVGDIVITQRDIREIQLAKAAFYAGAKILMERRGVKEADVDRVYLAGAFGTYIDKWSAKVVGLYPDIPLDRVKSVGNAAGMGAKHALITKEKRRDADIISRNTHYLELTIAPEFKREFISAMHFPHSDIGRFPSLKNLCEKIPSWSETSKQ